MPVCLLTDYGSDDEFVGVVHRVVDRIAPGATVVDLTHRIPRHDVRAGALALWRAAPYLAPAVVVAVVDPGVGTRRRAVALEVPTAEGPLLLVGPDNGVLVPAALRVGAPSRAVSLDDPSWHLTVAPGTGATFAGRDVLSPVGAHLASGVDLGRLGGAIAVGSLVGEPLQLIDHLGEGGRTRATVLWVDTYGNVQLDVAAPTLPVGSVVTVGGRRVVVAGAYADLGERVGLVADSSGLLALCVDRASAAELLGLGPGDIVDLATATGGAAAGTGARDG